jgi:hypothetical protein
MKTNTCARKSTALSPGKKRAKSSLLPIKDGSGLPAREDLGQELTRAVYPYDYAVGKAGFLNYDSELGAYLFTAKVGE